MKTVKNKKSGFTLVELMVVAIIVAILAAVAIPLMSGNKERAAATEAQAAISTIWTAERAQFAETGVWTSANPGNIHSIRGINDGDLQGKYFDHEDYSVSIAGTTMTISATTDKGVDGINGLVSLQINTDDNSSTWDVTSANSLLN